MLDYDFSALTYKDIETCSLALLSEHFGKRFERFKPGQDGGVDGRYFSPDGGEVIAQVKHWPRSDLAALLRRLRKSELQKVRKLRPSRYVLAVSHELSRANKREIADILEGFLREDDVFGREDLNELLAKNPAIEERFYKLWLGSSSVLRSILNAGVRGRSAHTLERIHAGASIYVETAAQEKAVETLEKHGTVIITGAPGVGKTTLAEHLCLRYAREGYDLFHIHEIEEAEREFVLNKKAIFYFDDFLGRNYLKALEGRLDTKVVDFIERVKRTPRSRFVLTSRTNVLNRGKQLSDLLERGSISRGELELVVGSLSLLEKGKILYNHIFSRQLDPSFAQSLFEEKRYLTIARHRNFSPRLVDFITDLQRMRTTPQGYWARVESTFTNPREVWRHLYESQLDDAARVLVDLVALNGTSIEQADLRTAYDRVIAVRSVVPASNVPLTFDTSARHLVGAMLQRSIEGTNELVSFDVYDPSVSDFCIGAFSQDLSYLAVLFEALDTVASVRALRSLYSLRRIPESAFEKVTAALLPKLHDNRALDAYGVALATFFRFHVELTPANEKVLVRFVERMVDGRVVVGDADDNCDLLLWAVPKIASDGVADFVEALIDEIWDEDGLRSLSGLLDFVDDEGGHLRDRLQESVADYWRDNIDTHLLENGVLDEFATDPDEDRAAARALEKAKQEVKTALAEYQVIDPDEVAEQVVKIVDVSDLFQSIRESLVPTSGVTPRPPLSSSEGPEEAALAELFDAYDP